MKNKVCKILLIVLVFICAFPYTVFADVDGYTTISGTFDDTPGGFYTESSTQALIIKDELLTEGKISAEFSSNVNTLPKGGIVFAGNGFRAYGNIEGNHIFYCSAYIEGSTVKLTRHKGYTTKSYGSKSIDASIFSASTVELSVSFTSNGDIKVFINDIEMISTKITLDENFGGEFGVYLYGTGANIEITNLTATSASHTEHTAGEIVSEVSANCVSEGTKEHSTCTVCGELIYNKDGVWTLTTADELVIAKNAENHIEKEENIEWITDENGHKKVCQCGEIFSKGDHDIDPDALEGVCTVCEYHKIHKCEYAYVSATNSTCTTKGINEHYKCEACGKLYKRSGNYYIEKTVAELENDSLDSDNHIDSADALPWTCDATYHKKTCRCGEALSSAKHDISSSALEGTCTTCGYVRIHTCTYTEISETPADCMTKGEMAHYKCEACTKLYIKNGNTYIETDKSDLVIAKDTSKHVDSSDDIEWTHDEKGHKKTCRCGAVLVSESHDIDSDALEGTCSTCGYVKVHTCKYTKVSKTSANCMEVGEKEHYKCEACGKLYIKTDGVYTETTESELIIAKDPANHVDTIASIDWTYDDSGHKKVCRCGAVRESSGHSIRNALEGTCTTCGYVRIHTCTYTEISETPADCMTKGEMAHYKCEACKDLYIKNGNTYAEIDKSGLVIAKDASNHVDSADDLEWTHDVSGHKKTCSCGVVLVSGSHDIDSDALEGTCTICGYSKVHTCTYTKVAKIPADCMTKGQKLHYKCNACGKLYLKNGSIYVETTLIELEIPKDATNHVDTINSLTWTHDANGHKKTCRCGVVRASGTHSFSASALSGTCSTCGYVKVHTCTYTKVAKIPADCMTKGQKLHYKCNSCGKLYLKNDGIYTETSLIKLEIPKDAANHVDTINSLTWTHNANGHKKTCRCGVVRASGTHSFSASALSGTCSTCGYVKVHTCTYTKVAKISADCMTKGQKLHYKCNACGKLYLKNGSIYVETTLIELEIPKDATNHVDTINSLTWTHDANGHKKTCRCGVVRASGTHSFSASALSGTCSTCGYVKVHTCTYTKIPETPATCMAKGEKLHYKCEACKTLYVKNGVIYTQTTKAELEIPKDASNHVDSADDLAWKSDVSGHQKACRCGTVLVSESHDIDSDALEGTCSICGYSKVHTCTYTKVAKISADCMTKGQKLHYRCEACGKLYLKNDGIYTETTLIELEIPKDATNHVDTIASLTWTHDANGHKKTCRCGVIVASGAHDIEVGAIEGKCTVCGYDKVHICEYTFVPATSANCVSSGEKEHYKCDTCGKLYSKTENSYVATTKAELEIPKNSDNHIDNASSLEWTHDASGHKKTCRCGVIVASGAHDIAVGAIEGECTVCGYDKAHICEYTFVPATSANCVSSGEKEHYKCDTCGKLYSKTENSYVATTKAELEIPKNSDNHIDNASSLEWTHDASGHKKTCRCGVQLEFGEHDFDPDENGECTVCGYTKPHECEYTFVEGYDGSCSSHGVKDHYTCTSCGKIYLKNTDGYTEVEQKDIAVKVAHILKKHNAIEGSCMTNACGEYWECEECGKLFSDENAESMIDSLPEGEKDPNNHVSQDEEWIIDTLEHFRYCSCGEKLSEEHIDDDGDGKCDICAHSNPQPGDDLMYYILGICMVLLIGGCIALVLSNKKLFVK